MNAPWCVMNLRHTVIVDSRGFTVATLPEQHPRFASETVENAKLLAAAPELLVALEKMIWTFEKLGNGKAMREARALVHTVRQREEHK